MTMFFSFAVLFRYLLAVGLENGQIKLIAASEQDITQWALWANVDDRYVYNHLSIIQMAHNNGIDYVMWALYGRCHGDCTQQRRMYSNSLLEAKITLYAL